MEWPLSSRRQFLQQLVPCQFWLHFIPMQDAEKLGQRALLVSSLQETPRSLLA
jgi:hypothetical protein